ncbi:MAG: hypothetical protein AABX28_00725 [Nanoarchaeota archaeon]
MNNKAEAGLIVSFIVGLLFGAILTWVYYVGFLNPGVTCPQYKCEPSTTDAKSQIIGSNFCEGEKGFLTGSDICTISLKNLEEKQGAYFTVNMACKTLDDDIPQILPNKQYLAPQETKSFTTTYDVGGKEWKCSVQNIIGETVNSCVLKPQ